MNTFSKIDLSPIESALESLVDVVHDVADSAIVHDIADSVSDTVTGTVVPTARRSGRRAQGTAREHPRVTTATIIALIGGVALVMWLRRRRQSQDANENEPRLARQRAA
jgi:hypothetical protein